MLRKNKVLVIGWDAADWKVIEPLIAKGAMPTLKKFLSEGVSGNIATLQPVLSPMLWTSIATGKRAWQHGIHGFVEPTPDGANLRQMNSTSRKVKAVWNIFNQNGLKSNVVGWWPSHPAEPINGVMVSNFFQKGSENHPDDWLLEKEAIHPPELLDILSSLRTHTAELTAEMLLPFLPKLSELDFEKDKVLHGVLKILSHASSIHNASTYLQENADWDFMAVYHDAIDHFCHLAMKFHPPKLKPVGEEQFDLYQHIVEAGYRFHDMMLERTLALAGEDTTVMIVSDHGFHSDHLRPIRLPKEPAAPAHEHRQFGIFAMRGPGVKKNETLFGVRLLDIAPTLLHLYGLPIGSDMEGSVLVQAFENPTEPKYVDSWEEIPGLSGEHMPGFEDDGQDSFEGLKQLEELGYIEPIKGDKRKHIEGVLRENDYNYALSLLDGGRYRQAAKTLERILEEDPTAIRYIDRLIRAYLKLGHKLKAVNVLDKLDDDFSKNPRIRFLKGLVASSRSQENKALKEFKELLIIAPNEVNILNQIAQVYRAKLNFDEALQWYRKVIEQDPNNVTALSGAGFCLLRLAHFDEAIDFLLESIEQLYSQPITHMHIGETLRGMKAWEQSAQAFELALMMNPSNAKVVHFLIELYEDRLDLTEKAEVLKERLAILQAEPVIIVSGLPRSGTSLMMQMLHKAGFEILTDEKREADDSNPKGYYEFEAVKSLTRNKGWVKNAQGKVVKVVAPLLAHLPSGQQYKVVFMKRPITEVLISQQVMLGKDKAKALRDFPLHLANVLQSQETKALNWMQSQPHIDYIEIDHHKLMEGDRTVEIELMALLGENEKWNSIWSAVDQNLYRSSFT